jgi:hypothetical protein
MSSQRSLSLHTVAQIYTCGSDCACGMPPPMHGGLALLLIWHTCTAGSWCSSSSWQCHMHRGSGQVKYMNTVRSPWLRVRCYILAHSRLLGLHEHEGCRVRAAGSSMALMHAPALG